MELARFLRSSTSAQELAGQHHALKILFKYFMLGDEGMLEYRLEDGRADIFLQHENRVIEVKTITEMTLPKLYRQVLGVIEPESPHADLLWVFYFYKLKGQSPGAPDCQY